MSHRRSQTRSIVPGGNSGQLLPSFRCRSLIIASMFHVLVVSSTGEKPILRRQTDGTPIQRLVAIYRPPVVSNVRNVGLKTAGKCARSGANGADLKTGEILRPFTAFGRKSLDDNNLRREIRY